MLILANMPIDTKMKIQNMPSEERYAKLQSEWENDTLEKQEKTEKTKQLKGHL